MKKNCWEIKNCGRIKGGQKVEELGICPATLDTSSHGINGGDNGGRYCWAVVGTLCGGKRQGTFAEKRLSCFGCEFYKMVEEEEGANFVQLMA